MAKATKEETITRTITRYFVKGKKPNYETFGFDDFSCMINSFSDSLDKSDIADRLCIPEAAIQSVRSDTVKLIVKLSDAVSVGKIEAIKEDENKTE